MTSPKYLFAILLTYCVTISSCSQTNSPTNSESIDTFAGSTPCDSSIRSLLKIPSDDTCKFIKWELIFLESKNAKNLFQLKISYGDYQPNTMNFLGGGKTLDIFGKYSTTVSTNRNSKKIYHLTGDHAQSEILLIQMDSNIFHFVDTNEHFIVGDASFGFVLNRVK